VSVTGARRPRVHYAWIVAGVTFVTLLVAAAIRATPGVLIVPLEQAFGWSRATIAFAISVNLVLYGLIGPFAAAVMDRVGVRLTLAAALCLLALGVGLTVFMTRAWQLVVLWGVVVGAGSGVVALVLGATLVNRWFVARRGLVMGVLTASTATGQLVFLPLLAWLVTHDGWRAPVLLMAGVALVLVPLAALLVRDFPADMGLVPYGGTAADAVHPDASGHAARAAVAALREGLNHRDFWFLAGTFFICGLSTNGLVGTHLIPACMDHGIPEVAAAGLLAAMGWFDLVGTTASGWLSDRWDSRKLLAWYYGLRGLSLFFLPTALAGTGAARWGFATFYGLDWIATVPPTVRLTADAFGRARVGMMFGWIVAAHQLGAAVAAFGAGLLRTRLGDYDAAFWAAGAMCLVAAALVFGIDAPARTSDLRRVPAEPLAVEV
jgi:sugar phosphate permease